MSLPAWLAPVNKQAFRAAFPISGVGASPDRSSPDLSRPIGTAEHQVHHRIAAAEIGDGPPDVRITRRKRRRCVDLSSEDVKAGPVGICLPDDCGDQTLSRCPATCAARRSNRRVDVPHRGARDRRRVLVDRREIARLERVDHR